MMGIPVLSQRLLGVLALVLAVSIWGAAYSAVKVVGDVVPPLTLACVRLSLVLAVLLPLTVRHGDRPALGRSSALLGTIGIALMFVCLNLGVARTTATDAVLIYAGGFPVLTLLLVLLLMRQRATARQLLGVAVSVLGVGVLVLHGAASLELSLVGDTLLLASALCGGVYTVVGERALQSGSLLGVVTGSVLYGVLALLPCVLIELARQGIGPLTTRDVLLVILLGAGTTANWLLYAYGLQQLQAIEVAVIGNADILVGVAVAVLGLGEHLGVHAVLGGCLILASIWLVTSPSGTAGEPIEATVPARDIPVLDTAADVVGTD